MRILICDDEPSMVRQLSEIIEGAYPDIELVGVHSSAELSERLAQENSDKSFDLAFVKIVFVSGNQDLVSKAFVKVDDCGYIYKPVDPTLLLGYIERERSGGRKSNKKYLEYSRHGVSGKVDSDRILYVSSERNSVEIHMVDGDKITTYGKLDDAEEQLKSNFVRCHKSYLVNLRYIAKYTATYFVLMNGETVPISRSKKTESADKYVLFKGASVK